MSTSTVRLVNVSSGAVVRVRSLRYDAKTRTVTLDPYYRMMALRYYRVEIRVGIKDLAGNTLAAQRWTFRTGRY